MKTSRDRTRARGCSRWLKTSHCRYGENACDVQRNRTFNEILDAHREWPAPPAPARETPGRMLQSVAECASTKVKSGVPAPW
jgi:hypothetical protein